jgi:hypothetical protein
MWGTCHRTSRAGRALRALALAAAAALALPPVDFHAAAGEAVPAAAGTVTQGAAGDAASAGAVREEGDIGGVPFLIMIPERWHGGLVMIPHSYRPIARWGRDADVRFGSSSRPGTEVYRTDYTPIGQAAMKRGYAFAASFYAGGESLREGVMDMEALRRYFVARHGGGEIRP